MDEFHYYADRDRGMAWQIPLLTLSHATFLLMSATLGDMQRIRDDLEHKTGRPAVLVSSLTRPVPLEFEYRETPLAETIQDLVERDRAPVYVVSFTQREAAEQAQNATSLRLVDRAQREALLEAIGGFRFDSVYGREMQRFLKAGIGLHHAGLLPKYRRLVERLAQGGHLRVVCGTDTLGVGVNVPIRTVLFTRLCKFDGEKTAILGVREFHQIAGRAGRKGFDTRGFVVCQAPEHVIENKRMEARAGDGKKKKFVRRKPPERGYLPWDASTFDRLVRGQPEELRSSFRVTHQMLLDLLQRADPGRGGGYGALVRLLEDTHESPARTSRLRREAAQLFRALRRAGVVVLERGTGPGGRAHLAAGLQRDFSLFHTLSLWLVEAVETLDPAAESHALDLVSLVEAVLENPRPILLRQQDVARTEALARMKAAGLEYEQRMEELEQIRWPRPNAERIYDSFNAFAAFHPWVRQENIRPKSIVRDLIEHHDGFDDYVRRYAIARVEGVLLRYLHDAYRTLVQTVPESTRTDAVVDVIAFLRAVLQRTDDSLVREWEGLSAPGPTAERPAPAVMPDVSRDGRAFRARIRAEMHRLVRALAAGDFAEAELCTRQDPDDPWPAQRFEAALTPFAAEHGDLVFDAEARLGDKTLIRELEDHRWQVRQVLCDRAREGTWCIEAVVDLRGDRAPEGPLVRVSRLGP
jgi:superfamily II RNA helicase